MPPFRSNPSARRKKRFQGPGWRDTCGSLYFQLKRSAQNFSRAHEVRRGITMDQLVCDLLCKIPCTRIFNLIHDILADVADDYDQLPASLFFAFILRKEVGLCYDFK